MAKTPPTTEIDCTNRPQEDDALMTSTIQRFLTGADPHRHPEEPYITTAPGAHGQGQDHGLVAARDRQYYTFFSQPTSVAQCQAGPEAVSTTAESPPASTYHKRSSQRGSKTKRQPREQAGEEHTRRLLTAFTTDAILSQRLIPDIHGVRPGELVQGVGLLPSLRAEFMEKYEVRVQQSHGPEQ